MRKYLEYMNLDKIKIIDKGNLIINNFLNDNLKEEVRTECYVKYF